MENMTYKLTDFEGRIWKQPQDSTKVDSVATTKPAKSAKNRNKTTVEENNSRRRTGSKASSGEKSSSAPRVSVRRQRR